MTTKEFKMAFAIANGAEDLSRQDIDVFDGFGLRDFQPVTVTVRQVARLIRYQALQVNDQWDSEALNEIRVHGRRKFIICDVIDGKVPELVAPETMTW